jgi:hypothetical protein
LKRGFYFEIYLFESRCIGRPKKSWFELGGLDMPVGDGNVTGFRFLLQETLQDRDRDCPDESVAATVWRGERRIRDADAGSL